MAAQPEAVSQSTQSKYRKVRKSADQPKIAENEVRITTSGRVKKYVDYALRLLEGGVTVQPTEAEAADAAPDAEKPSRRFETIILKATGRAINHAVTSAEVVKRRVGGLHQETKLETLEITDVWEPTEEGLKEVQTTRRVASITITLSKDELQVDKAAPGYQTPIVAGYQSSFSAEFGKPMGNRSPYRGRRDGRRGGGRPQGGDRRGGGGRRRGDGRQRRGGGGNRRGRDDNRDNRPRSGGQRNDDYDRDNRDNRDNRGQRRGQRQQGSPRGGPRRGGPPPQQRSYGQENQGYPNRRRRRGRGGGGYGGGGHRSPQQHYQGGGGYNNNQQY